MKKFLSILLVLVMILSFCACSGGGGEPEAPKTLEIGISRINATPGYEVSLYGYGEESLRITSTITHYIYITCIAARYGEDTILMYTLDLCSIRNEVLDRLKEAAMRGSGLPEENIVFGATHSHSCPSLYYNSANNNRYKEEYYTNVEIAAKKAIQDLAPATVSSTVFDIEGMNFVRHYNMLDGSVAGPNFGNLNLPIVGHPTTTDKTMTLVKFDRGEDKKDVLVVNWAAHAANSSRIGRNIMSPDFIGEVRDVIERETGMTVAYFAGAAGNTITHTYWNEEAHGLEWKQYGAKLGEIAIENLPNLEPVEVSSLRHSKQIYQGTVDHTEEHLLAQCKEINVVAFSQQDRTTANKMALDLGLTSYYHALKITTNAGKGETSPLEMTVFAIGPIAFMGVDYEMFSDAANAIREQTPFKNTVIMVTNQTYMPSDAAFEYGSYEASQTYFIRGTAETMVDEYMKMLNDLHE